MTILFRLIKISLATFAFALVVQTATADDIREERHKFFSEARKYEQEEIRRRLAAIPPGRPSPVMIVSIVRPFADWDYFVVEDAPIYWIPNSGQEPLRVEVPVGFVSDLASIPRAFWTALRPTGRHAYAAIVHDYLYWTQNRTREEADLIFRYALEDSNVDPAVISALYQSVRTFGQRAWDNNRTLREAGECRLINTVPNDFTVRWIDWKQEPNVCAATSR